MKMFVLLSITLILGALGFLNPKPPMQVGQLETEETTVKVRVIGTVTAKEMSTCTPSRAALLAMQKYDELEVAFEVIHDNGSRDIATVTFDEAWNYVYGDKVEGCEAGHDHEYENVNVGPNEDATLQPWGISDKSEGYIYVNRNDEMWINEPSDLQEIISKQLIEQITPSPQGSSSSFSDDP